MERSLSHVVALLILIHFSTHINSCSASGATQHSSKTNKEYIKTSCGVTVHRRLCYRSLAGHANKIKADPQSLAHTALNTTLTFTKYTSSMLSDMSKLHRLNPKEAAAVLHCLADINDSSNKLHTSMRELDQAKDNPDYELQLNDIQTWVNAALEDEGKCLAAFAGKRMKGKVKSTIRRRIVKCSRLTSNALALINSYSLAKTKSI